MASVKHFVSLQFPNFRELVGLLGRGSARRKAALYAGQYKHRLNSGMRLVAGFPPRRPGFDPGSVMWDL
jgi:hypothetical protein